MGSKDTNEWHSACQYEMDALEKLKVWSLVDLPEGQKAVKPRWDFKKKVDGCFCVQLVTKRFTKIEGVDFNKTISPCYVTVGTFTRRGLSHLYRDTGFEGSGLEY